MDNANDINTHSKIKRGKLSISVNRVNELFVACRECYFRVQFVSD